MNPYEEATGITDATRKDYLLYLAENLELDPELVFTAASMLGSTEDFDGLVTTLEDHAESQNWN